MKNLSIIILIFLIVVIGCRSGGKSTFSSRMRTQRMIRQIAQPKQGNSSGSSSSNKDAAADFAQFIADSKQAIMTGDTDSVNQMYADNYLGTFDDGKPSTTKQDLLNHTKDDPQFISVSVENAKLLRYDNIQTQLSCDTIINFSDGTVTYRGVNTLLYKNGNWQIVGWRGSMIVKQI